jgi:deoxyxylulose-5-phosphate synthase
MEMLEENEERPGQFRRIGFPDRFVEHGTQAEIRIACGVSAERVAEEALRLCSSGKSFIPSILYGIRSRLEKIV